MTDRIEKLMELHLEYGRGSESWWFPITTDEVKSFALQIIVECASITYEQTKSDKAIKAIQEHFGI